MSDFHFLRPWWLLALLPVLLLGWRLWTMTDAVRAWRRVIAPHLLPSLLVRTGTRSRLSPLPLLVVGWLLSVLALAGPAWRRVPAPFADDAAGLAIVLKVTPSMLNTDIQPTRLTRSIQKIQNLLAMRPNAPTALIAYSGTAHRVVPLTSDSGIVNSFAAELSPEIMPVEGDDPVSALRLAQQLISKSDRSGWILWICDAADSQQLKELEGHSQSNVIPINMLAAVSDESDLHPLKVTASLLHADVVQLTPDDDDVRRLAANTRFSQATDASENRWQDGGYWLVPLLAMIHLFGFRQGWTITGGTMA